MNANHRSRDVTSSVRRTVLLESVLLNELTGTRIIFANEALQHTGSFKFRAAYHLASNVPEQTIIAASSGNFGQALAYACSLVGKSCTIVMPGTSASVKIKAVREYGGCVEFVDTKTQTRQQKVAEVANRNPGAYIASAYDDRWVIEGNSSLGMEIAAIDAPLDSIVLPIGGGGLASGIIEAVRRSKRKLKIIGAEPARANDASRSFRSGTLISNDVEPDTIADGARTLCLGKLNWPILRDGLEHIIEVSEYAILEAMRVLFDFLNIKAEPTAAVALAAVLAEPDRFRRQTVCCIVTGGNVDPDFYAEMLVLSSELAVLGT